MKCCIKDFFSKSAGNCGLVIFTEEIPKDILKTYFC